MKLRLIVKELSFLRHKRKQRNIVYFTRRSEFELMLHHKEILFSWPFGNPHS